MRSVLIAALVAALVLPAAAPGAAAGADLVVCRRDTRARLKEAFRTQPRTLHARLVLLRRCRYLAVQPAIDAAPDGARVLILPGVYHPGLATVAGRSRLSLLGMGRRARDVILRGDRRAAAVVRATRADGLVVANLTAEEGASAGVDVEHTRGFTLRKLVVRWSGGDGVSVGAGAAGVVDAVEAYGNGDSGVAARGACGGVEISRLNAYGNVVGASGVARLRDSRLAGNATGALVGFPGCAVLDSDVVTADNAALFSADRQRFCASVPFAVRPRQLVCPRELVPVGTGVFVDGANGTIVRDSRIAGNRRAGIRLRWVPAAARGLDDPRRQFDTANGNRFLSNALRDNGADVSWDGEGAGNCWSPAPSGLPACPGGSPLSTGDPAVQAADVPCAAWDPARDPRPVGCSWFDLPGGAVVSRAVLLAGLLAGAMALAGVVLLVAGGDDAETAPPPRTLVWAARPGLVVPGGPILYGQVRNEGRRPLTLRAATVRVLDGAGRSLASTARFQQAYAPGTHGAAVTLAPGQSAPLTVAWRGAGARSVELGGVRLPVAVAQ